MTTAFSTTKSDQTGETTSEKKHIFANPFKPEICTILALAVYTWCKRRDPHNNRLLFDGEDQNKRYYQILVAALKSIPENIDLGCSRNDIGTHSNRKFAESTAVSRVDGPRRTQVCLRAGQSVGRTQDCYKFQEDDGDCFVGRTVAQLKFDADEFDILPCHFGPTTLAYLNEYGWNNILDGYEHYPPSFQRVIRFLFPALVYHFHCGDLARLYPSNHPLFAQRIFTNQALILFLKDKVILTHAYCAESAMWAQGVPAVIMLSREVRELRRHYDNTCNRNDAQFDQLRDLVHQRLEVLPDKIVEKICDRLVIQGAVQVTSADIYRIVSELLEAPGGKIDTIANALNALSNQSAELIARVSGNEQNSIVAPNSLQSASESESLDNPMTAAVHYWPGSDVIHFVPYNFRWPSYSVATMWNLWFMGNITDRICAYRKIIPKYDLVSDICKSNRSRTARVMHRLVQIAVTGGLITNARGLNRNNIAAVYDFAFPLLVEEVYSNPPGRPEDININTIANRMKRAN